MWFVAQNADIAQQFSVKLFVMSSWTIHCYYQNWGFFLWRASVEIWDYVKSLHLAIYTLAYVDNLYKPKLCRAWTQRKHFQNFRILKYILQSWIALLIFCKAFFCVKVLFERPCDLANYNFFFSRLKTILKQLLWYFCTPYNSWNCISNLTLQRELFIGWFHATYFIDRNMKEKSQQ